MFLYLQTCLFLYVHAPSFRLQHVLYMSDIFLHALYATSMCADC